MSTKHKSDKSSKVAVKAPAKGKAKPTVKAVKPTKTVDTLTGDSLRRSVKRAVEAKVKVEVKPVEVADVTPVPVVCENASTVGKTKAKAKASKAKAAPAVVECDPKVDVTTDVAPLNVATEAEETKAADAVYGYAEKVGIDIGDVVRISKMCSEYEALVADAGMEITDRVVWLAGQKAREFDKRVVHPNSPKTGISKAPKATRVAANGAASTATKARVVLFGHAATAVIRALRATCGMGFAQIRSVMDSMGADSVADATIRAQMAGNGLKRGEPAPLTAEQIDKAKAACIAVAC